MGGLDRWFKEKWTTPDGKPCGSNKDTNNPKKCRPSKKVNKKTPKTWGEMTEAEKKAAKADKAKANKENRQFGNKKFTRLKKKLKK